MRVALEESLWLFEGIAPERIAELLGIDEQVDHRRAARR
jgi:hypothetical protein